MNKFLEEVKFLEERILSKEDHHSFPEVAKEELNAFDFSTFEGKDSLREAILLSRNVPQYYSSSGFGKSNVTVANNGKFLILLMYMDQISTEIHDHPFEGVFVPLAGGPIQTSYEFIEEESLSSSLKKGKLNCIESKSIAVNTPVLIEEKTIHMLTRGSGGQYSMLVMRLLPKEKRQNAFYLSSGLKIFNSTNIDYLMRVLSSVDDWSKISPNERDSILSSFTLDELLQIRLRFASLTSFHSSCLGPLTHLLGQHNLSQMVDEHEEYLKLMRTKVSLLLK